MCGAANRAWLKVCSWPAWSWEVGRQPIGAASPFLSLVPSFVIETVVTRLRCAAAIPIRRLPERRRLGPPHDLGEEKHASQEKQEAEASLAKEVRFPVSLASSPTQQESM